VLQQRVENALAQRILAGEFKPGDRIRVDAEPSAGGEGRGGLSSARASEPVPA